MIIEIKPYVPEFSEQWDKLCREAKNGLFIFERNYMDYHSDRFVDDSVLVFSNDKLVAVFPAARENENTVVSHSGLTFGGLILRSRVRVEETIEIVNLLINHYRNVGTTRLIIKPIPDVFQSYPSGDIEYAL